MSNSPHLLLKMAFGDYYSQPVPQNYQGSAMDTAINLGVPLAMGAGALGVGAIGAIGKKLLAKKAPLKTVAQHVAGKAQSPEVGKQILDRVSSITKPVADKGTAVSKAMQVLPEGTPGKMPQVHLDLPKSPGKLNAPAPVKSITPSSSATTPSVSSTTTTPPAQSKMPSGTPAQIQAQQAAATPAPAQTTGPRNKLTPPARVQPAAAVPGSKLSPPPAVTSIKPAPSSAAIPYSTPSQTGAIAPAAQQATVKPSASTTVSPYSTSATPASPTPASPTTGTNGLRRHLLPPPSNRRPVSLPQSIRPKTQAAPQTLQAGTPAPAAAAPQPTAPSTSSAAQPTPPSPPASGVSATPQAQPSAQAPVQSAAPQSITPAAQPATPAQTGVLAPAPTTPPSPSRGVPIAPQALAPAPTATVAPAAKGQASTVASTVPKQRPITMEMTPTGSYAPVGAPSTPSTQVTAPPTSVSSITPQRTTTAAQPTAQTGQPVSQAAHPTQKQLPSPPATMEISNSDIVSQMSAPNTATASQTVPDLKALHRDNIGTVESPVFNVSDSQILESSPIAKSITPKNTTQELASVSPAATLQKAPAVNKSTQELINKIPEGGVLTDGHYKYTKTPEGIARYNTTTKKVEMMGADGSFGPTSPATSAPATAPASSTASAPAPTKGGKLDDWASALKEGKEIEIGGNAGMLFASRGTDGKINRLFQKMPDGLTADVTDVATYKNLLKKVSHPYRNEMEKRAFFGRLMKALQRPAANVASGAANTASTAVKAAPVININRSQLSPDRFQRLLRSDHGVQGLQQHVAKGNTIHLPGGNQIIGGADGTPFLMDRSRNISREYQRQGLAKAQGSGAVIENPRVQQFATQNRPLVEMNWQNMARDARSAPMQADTAGIQKAMRGVRPQSGNVSSPAALSNTMTGNMPVAKPGIQPGQRTMELSDGAFGVNRPSMKGQYQYSDGTVYNKHRTGVLEKVTPDGNQMHLHAGWQQGPHPALQGKKMPEVRPAGRNTPAPVNVNAQTLDSIPMKVASIKPVNFSTAAKATNLSVPKVPNLSTAPSMPKMPSMTQPTAPKGLNIQTVPQNISPVQLPSPSVQISPSSSPTQMSAMTGSGQAAPNLAPKVAAWYGGGFGVANYNDSTISSTPISREELASKGAPSPLSQYDANKIRPATSDIQRVRPSYLHPGVKRPNATLQAASYLNSVFLDIPRTDYATPEQHEAVENQAPDVQDQQSMEQEQSPEATSGQQMVPGEQKTASTAWHDPVDIVGLGLLAAPHIYSAVHTPNPEEDEKSKLHQLMTSEGGKRALELLGLGAIAAGPIHNVVRSIRPSPAAGVHA